MKSVKRTAFQKHRGAALIISMIFVLIFSALAVSMATMSGANVQIAENQRKVNCALANAESGMNVMRYWLSRIMIPNTTPPAGYHSTIVTNLQNDLVTSGISNITVNYVGSMPPVTLDSASGQTFSGKFLIDPNEPYLLQAYATGSSGPITRTIKVNYSIEPYEYPIFDFGIATKGPLHFPGNPTVTGENYNSEADIYIESENNNIALLISGNTNFDGDTSITNTNANVDFQGDVLIGGEQGEQAIDNHVFIGAEPVEFPAPDTQRFRQYATGNIIDSSTNTEDSLVLTNATIQPGTNPCFEGNITIQGILLIEQPNTITFNGNVNVKGLIVAEGDAENPGTNKMTFLGNFDTDPYPPDAQFDAIRTEIGSSIVAPGFGISFQGNFSTLDGVMAVSGAHFSGNVNAVIKGSVINYSDTPTIVEGNATLHFDRADSTKVPAGFDLYSVLKYKPDSYSEIIL